MNISKAYSHTIGRVPSDEAKTPVSPAEEALHVQQRLDWLQSAVTKQMFAELHKQEKDLIDSVISDAVSYSVTNNHQQMIAKLIRVDTIRKLKETYGNA